MNWNKFGLFKLPNRHKRFEYVPRYYNAEKEELQARIDRAKNENMLDDQGKFAREIKFKSQMEDKWGGTEYKSLRRQSNIRLIIILGVIIVAFYYIFMALDGLGYFIDENLDKLK